MWLCVAVLLPARGLCFLDEVHTRLVFEDGTVERTDALTWYVETGRPECGEIALPVQGRRTQLRVVISHPDERKRKPEVDARVVEQTPTPDDLYPGDVLHLPDLRFGDTLHLEMTHRIAATDVVRWRPATHGDLSSATLEVRGFDGAWAVLDEGAPADIVPRKKGRWQRIELDALPPGDRGPRAWHSIEVALSANTWDSWADLASDLDAEHPVPAVDDGPPLIVVDHDQQTDPEAAAARGWGSPMEAMLVAEGRAQAEGAELVLVFDPTQTSWDPEVPMAVWSAVGVVAGAEVVAISDPEAAGGAMLGVRTGRWLDPPPQQVSHAVGGLIDDGAVVSGDFALVDGVLHLDTVLPNPATAEGRGEIWLGPITVHDMVVDLSHEGPGGAPVDWSVETAAGTATLQCRDEPGRLLCLGKVSLSGGFVDAGELRALADAWDEALDVHFEVTE